MTSFSSIHEPAYVALWRHVHRVTVQQLFYALRIRTWQEFALCQDSEVDEAMASIEDAEGAPA